MNFFLTTTPMKYIVTFLNSSSALIKKNLHLTSFLLIALLLILSTGCSSKSSQAKVQQDKWLQDGSIVLSRPAPAVAPFTSQTRMFGFLPSLENQDRMWISVRKKEKKLHLMEGNKAKLSINSKELSQLPTGVFEVVHKQRHPVWHANNDYFTHRKLSTPPEGDAERLLRGVLGEFALFLDKDLPIHSGPVQLPELGGLRLAEDDIARIYYHVDIGAPVVIE